MVSIIFATNNENKVAEINSIIPDEFNIISLKQAGIEIEIDEPFDTFVENACEKARVIFELTGQDCFAEDTGLETEALHGEPGVRSARYSGENRSSQDNINKLLLHLKSETNRKARFKTVICLIFKGEQVIFEGVCTGKIHDERKGESGFGYDAVFIPDGSVKTFGEMSMAEKNQFSHRKKAVEKLVEYLKNA